MLRAFLVSRWFSASSAARPLCPALTHDAVALVHRSRHPFASHVEKLVSNFLIRCPSSKPYVFAGVVHAVLVGDHWKPSLQAAIGLSATSVWAWQSRSRPSFMYGMSSPPPSAAQVLERAIVELSVHEQRDLNLRGQHNRTNSFQE